MKSYVAFLKSPVGKFHSVFAAFILFNLISGFVNLFIHFVIWLDMVHFYTGLLIVIAPLAYLLGAKNRKIIVKAFAKMAFPGSADIKSGKRLGLVFKLITLAIALLILINAVSGVLMRFHLLPAVSFDIHVLIFMVLLALVPLHAVLGAVVRSAHAKKPARASGG